MFRSFCFLVVFNSGERKLFQDNLCKKILVIIRNFDLYVVLSYEEGKINCI